jgi:hypothetical protein
MATTKTAPCFKCHGKGTLSYHRHIENGVCFQCSGSGVIEIKPVAHRVDTRTPAEIRERIILDLAAIIRNAQADRLIGDEETYTTIRQTLAAAPADVRDRAVKALTAAGVSL